MWLTLAFLHMLVKFVCINEKLTNVLVGNVIFLIPKNL